MHALLSLLPQFPKERVSEPWTHFWRSSSGKWVLSIFREVYDLKIPFSSDQADREDRLKRRADGMFRVTYRYFILICHVYIAHGKSVNSLAGEYVFSFSLVLTYVSPGSV
jgi:hypothetical protein